MIKNICFLIAIEFFILFRFSQSATFPKILWSYWEHGFEKDNMMQLYDRLHRLDAQGWEVRLTNRTTVMPFLKRIPYYQDDIDKINFYLLQHKSDYIRYLLISYYGGVWMDISSFFVEELDWLDFDRLRQNEDVINKHGAEPDVLLFTTSLYGSKQVYYSKQQKVQYEISPGYELWFIAAKPQSYFFKIFIQQYRKGLLKNMHVVSGSHNYISILNNYISANLTSLKNVNYLSSLQIIQFILQSKQLQLDQQTALTATPSNSKSSQKQSQRQLAVWHYKIWHIKSIKGPFVILENTRYDQPDALVRYSRKQLAGFGMGFRYFVKFVGEDRAKFKKYFYEPIWNKDFSAVIETLRNLQDQLVERYFCPQQFAIHEESVFYQYVLKRSSYKFDVKLTNSSYRPLQQCSQLRNFVKEAKKANFHLFYQELLKTLIPLAVLLLVVLIILLLIMVIGQYQNKFYQAKY